MKTEEKNKIEVKNIKENNYCEVDDNYTLNP